MHGTSDPFPEIRLGDPSSTQQRCCDAAPSGGVVDDSGGEFRCYGAMRKSCRGQRAAAMDRCFRGHFWRPGSHIVRWSVLGSSRKELLESLACTGFSRDSQNGELVCKIFVTN